MATVQEALQSLREPDSARQCKIGDWIDTLPEDDQAAVAEILGLEASDIKVHQALQPVFRVSREMIRQHRSMSCRCFR